MTRKNKPLDRTAELLFRISVKRWKGRSKLPGMGQLCKPSKRGVKIEIVFLDYLVRSLTYSLASR